jgi:hypothetical protein
LKYRDRCKEDRLYLSIVAGSNHNKTIFAREYLGGNNRGVYCAKSMSFPACDEIIGRNIRETRNLKKESFTNALCVVTHLRLE